MEAFKWYKNAPYIMKKMVIGQLEVIAQTAYIPLRMLIRTWIVQRLMAERIIIAVPVFGM